MFYKSKIIFLLIMQKKMLKSHDKTNASGTIVQRRLQNTFIHLKKEKS